MPSSGSAPLYPACPTVTRAVTVGGLTKAQLLERLRAQAIALNEFAERLFADDRFTVSRTRAIVSTVEVHVRDLGFPQGATIPDLYARAHTLGLAPCPLDLAPHLKLQYMDQPEGASEDPERSHRAPSGSITVATEAIGPEDDAPRGFYLRRIDGTLWLRGYRASDDHVWSAEDRWVFCLSQTTGRDHVRS